MMTTTQGTRIDTDKPGEYTEGGVEVTVHVMRSVVFLLIRDKATYRTLAHVDIEPANWKLLADTPPPDGEPGQEN